MYDNKTLIYVLIFIPFTDGLSLMSKQRWYLIYGLVYSVSHHFQQYFGPGWLNELGSWIT